MMTAVQFADHCGGLEGVCLNTLGKYAKEIAGSEYTKIPHIDYGSVGYVSITVWMQALGKYYRDHNSAVTFRRFCNHHGVPNSRDRRLIEPMLFRFVNPVEHGVYPSLWRWCDLEDYAFPLIKTLSDTKFLTALYLLLT